MKGELFTYGKALPPVIMAAISACIIFMSIMSIMENLKKMAEIEKEIDVLKRIQQREQ